MIHRGFSEGKTKPKPFLLTGVVGCTFFDTLNIRFEQLTTFFTNVARNLKMYDIILNAQSRNLNAYDIYLKVYDIILNAQARNLNVYDIYLNEYDIILNVQCIILNYVVIIQNRVECFLID